MNWKIQITVFQSLTSDIKKSMHLNLSNYWSEINQTPITIVMVDHWWLEWPGDHRNVMGDKLKKAIISHCLHKQFHLVLINTALIAITDEVNIS
jgi:hypothetical protein